jgi:hypothetical protein
MNNRYNLEALFHSVNDIFEQFDEGRITEDMANEIVSACCKVFIETNDKEKRRKRDKQQAISN